MAPFLWMGFICLRLHSHYEETVYFLPFSSQVSVELNRSTSEGWRVEYTSKPPSGFEPTTSELGNQRLNH